jgi:hypothetical protein
MSGETAKGCRKFLPGKQLVDDRKHRRDKKLNDEKDS